MTGREGTALLRNMIMGVILFSLARAVPAGALPQESKGGSPASLDVLLVKLASFQHGPDDGVLFELKSHVRSRRTDPGAMEACETAFIAFLESEATLAGKQAVCRELGLIGTDRSIPVLGRMLVVEVTSDMARYGLEGLPGTAADGALLRALGALRGDARLGVVSSLGNRRCAEAVPDLERLLRSSDGMEAGAAAEALGRIGGSEAARALAAAASPRPSSCAGTYSWPEAMPREPRPPLKGSWPRGRPRPSAGRPSEARSRRRVRKGRDWSWVPSGASRRTWSSRRSI
jgi:hypothetical protein